MLAELTLENFAVIEQARVRFGSGLNLLTGETGSGKSIVVDALGLLLGGRASTEMIRTGAAQARVSGVFEVDTTRGEVEASRGLTGLLEEAGIEIEDGELLVEREIQGSGKSRAYVGNRPVTVSLLKSLAPYLADIHGQHDQYDLFSAQLQLVMLDEFAGAGAQRAAVGEIYRQWRDAAAELEDLDRNAQEKLRLMDLWKFQRKEIEAVAPQPEEDDDLAAERAVLRNVVRLTELAGSSYDALHENADSISGQLSAITRNLEELAEIDPSTAEIASTLEQAVIGIDETAHQLRSYLGKLDADPARLDEVESRLAAIEKLKRKYGGSVEEILQFLDEARRELAAVENTDQLRADLEARVAKLGEQYTAEAAKLSGFRKQAAKKLAKATEAELAALAMDKSRVVIEVAANIQQNGWTERGYDEVEFLIAPNPGEEPKPIARIASGGELSRVALALKTCTAANAVGDAASNASTAKKKRASGTPRTLVFDEVDAGVGGGAAEAVGRRLKRLSAGNQVLCVTHLPQIAGFADHHFSVAKHEESGRTLAIVTELTGPDRAQEIGRMLSGERITPEALRHAKQLIKMAGE